MPMKKIVVVANQMVIGGIEKSLIELLSFLTRSYDVTLILSSVGGDLFSKIPGKVKVKLMWDKKKCTKFKLLKCKFLAGGLKCCRNYAQECNLLTKIYDKEKNKYDLAIAYGTPVSLPNYYVINNISSRKRIMYIHNDVKEINISTRLSENIYRRFDKFVAVSESARKSFIDFFPYLKDKVIVLENLINRNEIMQLSKEPLEKNFSNDYIHICTVGRIEFEKGQDIIPTVLQLLKKDNLKVKWHLIGDGSIKKNIQKKALNFDVSDMIIFEGFQQNPYKFISCSDIYVQTSRQEGFGITLKEAKCLNKIIITTNFPCAYEQIVDNQTGFIVSYDSVQIAGAIKRVIYDDVLKNRIVSNLCSRKKLDDIDRLKEFLEEELYE